MKVVWVNPNIPKPAADHICYTCKKYFGWRAESSGYEFLEIVFCSEECHEKFIKSGKLEKLIKERKKQKW